MTDASHGATTDPVALNQWIPCAYPGQIAPGGALDTLILGQAVRVARDPGGAHRCWRLVDGAPADALPVQERYAVVFTTLGATPRPLPAFPEFDEPGRRVVNSGGVGVNTSPFRIVENFLDMAHFCFVHTEILGAADKTEVLQYKTEHRTDVDEIWATECRFFQPAASKSAQDEGGGQITHYKYRVMSPFSVALYKTVFGDEEKDDVIALFIQPKTETSCIAYMPMALLDADSTMTGMIEFQQTIFLQDRIILENQRPKLLPLTPNAEVPTKADLSSVAYRRWLKASGVRFGLWRPEAA